MTAHTNILHITAEEETTGNKKQITITIKNETVTWSNEETERLNQEAEFYKTEDNNLKNKVKEMNALENYLHNMRKVMKRNSVDFTLILVATKMKIEFVIIKGKKLLDFQHHQLKVCVSDFLRELKSIF